MNISDFPGFPGFLGMARSHPDKQRVQKETKIEDDTLTMEEEIDKVTKKLRYIETLACRAVMDKEMIDRKRKEYTMIFKTLLTLKERQNTK